MQCFLSAYMIRGIELKSMLCVSCYSGCLEAYCPIEFLLICILEDQ